MSIFSKLFKKHKKEIEEVAVASVENGGVTIPERQSPSMWNSVTLPFIEKKLSPASIDFSIPPSGLKDGKESSEFKVTIAFNIAAIIGTLLGHVAPESAIKSVTILNAIYSIGRVVLKLFKK